jgi:hypothetical protein
MVRKCRDADIWIGVALLAGEQTYLAGGWNNSIV